MMKSQMITGFSGSLHTQMLFSIVLEDAGILFFILALSLFFQTKARIIPLTLVLGLSVFYAMDSMLIQSLYARLTLPTLYMYRGELRSVLTFLSVRQLALICLVIGILFVMRKKSVIVPLRRRYLAGILFLCGLAPWVVDHNPYASPVLDIASLNIIRINQKVVVHRILSEDLLLKTRKDFPYISRGLSVPDETAPAKNCETLHKRNIILLISESLSQIDSMRSGALYDRLPGIDAVQARGLTLTNVVSDGNNTSDALAALLLGVEPLPTNLFSNDMMRRFPASLLEGRNIISYAKQRGYKTILLTNIALPGFQQNREWLISLGFDQFWDGASHLFSGARRFAFDSPGDDMLYQKAMTIIAQEREPFLFVMLTISLHKPYMLPSENYAASDEPLLNQLHYVDETTVSFYRELLQKRYFEKGTLVLVGDHRRMDPLDPKETAYRGMDSYGRVLACIVGDGVDSGLIDRTPLNLTDLNTVLLNLIRGCNLRGERPLSSYNKHHVLNIDKSFTVHVLNDSLGMIVVRIEDQQPFLLKLRRTMDASAFSQNPALNGIVAYLALSAADLDSKQKRAAAREHGHGIAK
jgi:hypothetical protein